MSITEDAAARNWRARHRAELTRRYWPLWLFTLCAFAASLAFYEKVISVPLFIASLPAGVFVGLVLT